MPPQLLSHIRRGVGISFTPESVVERPQVAAGIAQCIACWSWVEAQVSRLFVVLLRQNPEAGTALYNSLGGASLKANSIRVLAISTLEPDDHKIIQALLRVIDSHEKVRNKIANWYWGVPTEIDDALVLVDPKYLLRQTARLSELHLQGIHPKLEDVRIPDDEIYVYRVQDLELV